uniref:OSJNBa0040D17.1 protein n=1 Tax=Oryza sativa subsp. japonica TaxID=39947 RepID=Q7XSE1_ORYSJ|nr:OSJNBb0033G08.13 [Oryza sativa Japonica Group]CAE04535.2 OSJNBa0040D17.1 [Oryza sativa Japonica Group]
MGKSPSFGILDDNDCDEVESSEEATKNLQSDDDDVDDRPGWLPDGWIMEYYICPVSGSTFTMKSEVLHYLFSEMDQRFMESKNCAVGCNLMRTHEWLPKGWLVEIRAGGDNMDKMYKFYVYPPHRVRLYSKDDVLLYIKEMKISGFDTDGQCNTSTQENILAILEFNPKGLPQGWVKEVVFRKTNTGGIRRDRHYTDPIKNYVFRTMRSAALYVETGKVTIRAFVQKTSVHEVYSFEKFTHLHESLQKRLNLGRTNQLRTRSSKHEKLALKEEILSDEQGSSSGVAALLEMDCWWWSRQLWLEGVSLVAVLVVAAVGGVGHTALEAVQTTAVTGRS